MASFFVRSVWMPSSKTTGPSQITSRLKKKKKCKLAHWCLLLQVIDFQSLEYSLQIPDMLFKSWGENHYILQIYQTVLENHISHASLHQHLESCRHPKKTEEHPVKLEINEGYHHKDRLWLVPLAASTRRLFRCSSVPVVLFDTPGISRCRSQHISVESSSLLHHSIYQWFICFTWWSIDELENLHADRTTVCFEPW